jgi:hypothetical protein
MRLPPARPLFAALAALAVTSSVASSQDADPGAAGLWGTSIEAVRSLATSPATHAQLPAPLQKTAPKMAFNRPLMVFSAAAAADWASTAWSLSHPASREDNPLIAWAGAPPAIIAAGAAIDTVGAYAWMKSTRNHRKLQSVGLLVAAAFRGYLVVHNLRINRQAGLVRDDGHSGTLIRACGRGSRAPLS